MKNDNLSFRTTPRMFGGVADVQLTSARTLCAHPHTIHLRDELCQAVVTDVRISIASAHVLLAPMIHFITHESFRHLPSVVLVSGDALPHELFAHRTNNANLVQRLLYDGVQVLSHDASASKISPCRHPDENDNAQQLRDCTRNFSPCMMGTITAHVCLLQNQPKHGRQYFSPIKCSRQYFSPVICSSILLLYALLGFICSTQSSLTVPSPVLVIVNPMLAVHRATLYIRVEPSARRLLVLSL
jgi:hypothetical protein